MPGNILFVHGTGVRLKAYQKTYTAACERAREEGIVHTLVECEWGDALGIAEPSLSIPGPPSQAQAAHAAEAAQEWAYLEEDPLFELRVIAGPDDAPAASGSFGQQPEHEKFWERVVAYSPSMELDELLRRGNALSQWPDAWAAVISAPGDVARRAVAASGNDTADAAMALARALFAELNRRVQAQGLPALGYTFRDRLIDRLRVDWGFLVFALAARIKKLVSGVIRKRRRDWSDRVWPQLGDILLYQANGDGIRGFIRRKIDSLEPPVYVIAHSLGGIACVDLLALPDAPEIAGLVTVGSQAPLLYELGALYSLRRPQPLPDKFPLWINLYDSNDVLSYVAEKLFPGRVTDVEVVSGELPLAAHSAYWNCDETWNAIKTFVK